MLAWRRPVLGCHMLEFTGELRNVTVLRVIDSCHALFGICFPQARGRLLLHGQCITKAAFL